MHKRIIGFIREAKEELLRVNWPTKKQVVTYTVMVVVISFAVAVFLGGLDYGFSTAVNKYLVK